MFVDGRYYLQRGYDGGPPPARSTLAVARRRLDCQVITVSVHFVGYVSVSNLDLFELVVVNRALLSTKGARDRLDYPKGFRRGPCSARNDSLRLSMK